MQYVLLGEHWRANRAAAGNARGRDLVGYCLGDTNQAGKDGGRHFLRRSGVTLVGLEFTRPSIVRARSRNGRRGCPPRFSSPDARPKHTYFFIPARLEYADIAPNGKMLGEDEFKTWIRREAFTDFLITERQGDYLKEMATPRHLNFDDTAFHRTFPKAIAFELEENVERFIREFILEESPLDVREVRAALRAYDETRKRLEKQEDEAAFLRRIGEQHALYETNRREEAILQHTGHALKLLQAEERRERHAAELKRLEDSTRGRHQESESGDRGRPNWQASRRGPVPESARTPKPLKSRNSKARRPNFKRKLKHCKRLENPPASSWMTGIIVGCSGSNMAPRCRWLI